LKTHFAQAWWDDSMQEFEEPLETSNPFASPRATSPDSVELPSEDYTDQEFHPFKTIWTSPRKTIRRIVATDPTLHVILLACLAGIGSVLDRASMRSQGDKVSVEMILGIAIFVGPLGGLFSLWMFSHLIRISGTWIGGVAPRAHLKAAMAWASVPSIAGLPLWIVSFALMGSELFTSETPLFDARVEEYPLFWIPFIGIGLLEMTLGIWGIVIFCNTIAEVQGFRSAWTGLGNTILAGLLLVVPITIIVFGVLFLTMPR
jgi:hypothetical protein